MFRQITASLVLVAAVVSAPAFAQAIHDAGSFTGNTLARNDDGSTSAVALGFNVNFFGRNFSNVYVNNNGNVTFNAPLGTFTPFNLLSTSTPILAPFFADVDTRGAASNVVQYGQSTLDGRSVFGVNWINVGYFPNATDKLNSFQLIITDRSDIGTGDFDFQYNYNNITWETGGASGGAGGLGGNSARVGWSNGVASSQELAGSAINGAFLNGGANALVSGALNSSIAGQYNFQVRNGVVLPPVPEPETYAMMLAGLAALGLVARRKKAIALK